MAVGAASGTGMLTFPVETLNTGGAYVLPEGGSPLAGNLEQEVPVAALDDLDVRRPVRLIKMDAEGAEPKVVQGAARLLREDRPVILCELHPVQLERASRTTPMAFVEQLRAAGYRAHGLRNGIIDEPLDTVPADEIVSVALLPV